LDVGYVGVGKMTEVEGKKEESETAKKIVHTYPLIRVRYNGIAIYTYYA
jgi:hypothetical protein